MPPAFFVGRLLRRRLLRAGFFAAGFFAAGFFAAGAFVAGACTGGLATAVFLAGAGAGAPSSRAATGSPATLTEASAGTADGAVEAAGWRCRVRRARLGPLAAAADGPGRADAVETAVRVTWPATILPIAAVPLACSTALPAAPTGFLIASRAASVSLPSGFFLRATSFPSF